MADLAEVIEFVRAATGPDRRLEAVVLEAVGLIKVRRGTFDTGEPFTACYSVGGGDRWPYFQAPRIDAAPEAPAGAWTRVTSSLDAVVSLIEAKLPGCGFQIDVHSDAGSRHGSEAHISQSDAEWTYSGWPTARAPTPPLALLLAFLEALRAKEAGNG